MQKKLLNKDQEINDMMNNKIEHQEYTSNILNEYRLKYGISA